VQSYVIGWSGFEIEGATYRDVSLTAHVPASGVVLPFLFARKSGPFFGPGPAVVGGYEYGQDALPKLYLAYQGQPFSKVEYDVDWVQTGADVQLNLDVIGDQAFLTAWPQGQVPPTSPQLSILIPNGPADEGTAGVLAMNLADDPRPAVFRDFSASPVPEPSSLVLALLVLVALAASLSRRFARPASSHRT
jgi:hypothetical protein